MDEMVYVTYLGPHEEVTVHVAGGFKIVLSRNKPKAVPSQYASVFSGEFFVVASETKTKHNLKKISQE